MTQPVFLQEIPIWTTIWLSNLMFTWENWKQSLRRVSPSVSTTVVSTIAEPGKPSKCQVGDWRQNLCRLFNSGKEARSMRQHGWAWGKSSEVSLDTERQRLPDSTALWIENGQVHRKRDKHGLLPEMRARKELFSFFKTGIQFQLHLNKP